MSQLALQLIQQEKAAKTGYLDLGRCGLIPANPLLQDVWDALSELTHLETLIFSSSYPDRYNDGRPRGSLNKGESNQLDKIPIVISKLSNLKLLYCSHNQISKLENLPASLEELHINFNQITKIENLPENIKELHIYRNKVSKIGDLPQSISTFDISNNQVKNLRPLLPLIKRQQNPLVVTIIWPANNGQIGICKNPIRKPPMKVAKQGNEAILRYFEENEKKDNNT